MKSLIDLSVDCFLRKMGRRQWTLQRLTVLDLFARSHDVVGGLAFVAMRIPEPSDRIVVVVHDSCDDCRTFTDIAMHMRNTYELLAVGTITRESMKLELVESVYAHQWARSWARQCKMSVAESEKK